MTNEKDREEALSWRDAKDMVWKLRECKDYDDQARMLQSLACNLRSEAVEAERERWKTLLVKAMSFAREYAIKNPRWTPVGMTEQDPNGVHAFIEEVDSILSDDQEANRG